MRSNRSYIWAAAICSLMVWVVFKYYYPYPHMILDSYYYLQAAAQHTTVNYWPIGYSKFLQLIGIFTHSPLLTVTIQWILQQAIFLFFFLSIRLFFQPGKWASVLLFLFLFLNPLFICSSNFILSEPFFLALSTLWLTQLLWLLYRPAPYMIITQGVLLLLTFSVRYNAIYYPLIAALVFIFSRLRLWHKIAGIVWQSLLIGGFILYTTSQLQQLTGIRQFSPFGGWKLANNALYMYESIYPERDSTVPAQLAPLHQQVRQYFGTRHEKLDMAVGDATHGSNYMFMHNTPLLQYMYQQYGEDYQMVNVRKTALMGPLYQSYGTYLIQKYPAAYLRHFVWPNFLRYLMPYPEMYQSYSPFALRDDDMGPVAKQWFAIETLSPSQSRMQTWQKILSPFGAVSTLLHLVFFLSLTGFLLLKGYQHTEKNFVYSLVTAVALWCCDCTLFSFTASVVLRYQLFMMVLECAFALLLLDRLYRIGQGLGRVTASEPQNDSYQTLPPRYHKHSHQPAGAHR